MTTQRSHTSDTGHSSFAKRGQSSEERMPDDNSAEKFGPDSEDKPADDGQMYGSGGSYGYGGAFEHGGQRGYDVSFAEHSPVEAGSDRYEAQGKFGHDTEGTERAGIGHPGKDEKRSGPEVTDGAPASGHPAADDARKGYSQDSGYAQSGGSPAPGGSKADKKKVSRKSN
ncbi:MAG TPA: hypothetical protein VFX59_21275 [Polyangiales bacterium]|nr:hypothetical protein [Polyangiales bacterium]